MGAGGLPIDLILFGMIAAFLVLRLRSILGRRTGYEPPPQPMPRPGVKPAPIIEARAEPPAGPAKPARPLPDPDSPAGQALAQLREADRAFDPARFLSGAEQAFRLIVTRFAAGDRAGLRPLLTDEIFQAFGDAISQREVAKETVQTEIRSILDAAITGATLRPTPQGAQADIHVRFTSEQISITHDEHGKPVAGVDALTHMIDQWTFERMLGSSDPAWRLAAASSG